MEQVYLGGNDEVVLLNPTNTSPTDTSVSYKPTNTSPIDTENGGTASYKRTNTSAIDTSVSYKTDEEQKKADRAIIPVLLMYVLAGIFILPVLFSKKKYAKKK